MKVSDVVKAPDGIYVAVRFNDDTVERLKKYQEEQDIPNPLDSEEFHTTVVYSRTPIDWKESDCDGIEAEPLRLEKWETKSKSNCLVLLIDCPHLHKRFKHAMDLGASYDFPDYKPHITLSYDVGRDYDADALPTPDFAIQLAHEYSEPLDSD